MTALAWISMSALPSRAASRQPSASGSQETTSTPRRGVYGTRLSNAPIRAPLPPGQVKTVVPKGVAGSGRRAQW
jgi:hypothetical protein